MKENMNGGINFILIKKITRVEASKGGPNKKQNTITLIFPIACMICYRSSIMSGMSISIKLKEGQEFKVKVFIEEEYALKVEVHA
jgi:hypothetical protein